jgi:hypothetical protein
MATALRDDLERARADVQKLLELEAQLGADVEHLQARLRAIHQSPAWRLSRPLRAVLRKMR